MNKLGELIRKKRRILHKTQEELARTAGVGQSHINQIERSYISKIEKCRKLPSIKTMKKICVILQSPELMSIYLREKYPELVDYLK